jgi:hypothetical protein
MTDLQSFVVLACYVLIILGAQKGWRWYRRKRTRDRLNESAAGDVDWMDVDEMVDAIEGTGDFGDDGVGDDGGFGDGGDGGGGDGGDGF